MGEIERWFLEEYSRYGFSIGQTLYDPYTFSPMKPVMLTTHQGQRMTRIKIVPEMADDVTLPGGRDPNDDFKDIITQQMTEQYGEYIINECWDKPLDFKPIKDISKLNFNDK